MFQDASKGRWVATVELGIQGGRRVRKKFARTSREAATAALDDWFRDNPAPVRSQDGRATHLEQARERGRHTPAEWRRKVLTYAGMCHYCTRPWRRDLHQDHMTPISRGGSDAIDNLVPTCGDCNCTKSTMTAAEFVEWAARTGYFEKPRTRGLPVRPKPSVVIQADDGSMLYFLGGFDG